VNAPNRIALGTAQFGLDYGITNQAGRVPEEQARDILNWATSAGVDTIDTAHGYGDSEAVIGRALLDPSIVRIVTKTPHLGSASSAAEAAQVTKRAFAASLGRLNRTNVAALLVHNAEDLLGRFGDVVWEQLEGFKAHGQVERIGVSVYEGSQVDALVERFALDIVQLPYNALDQRLLDGGQLRELAERGIEVHARSLFLQGLLLQPSEAIPRRFAALQPAMVEFDRAFGAQGLSRLEGLLADAFQHPEISCVVCGVTRLEELKAIVSAAERASDLGKLSRPSLPRLEPVYLDPSRWEELS
jgi:aryl-alcohol dehydrogenase-like predicted oxidoreductase